MLWSNPPPFQNWRRIDTARSEREKEGFGEVEAASGSFFIGLDDIVEFNEVLPIFEPGKSVIGEKEFSKDREDFGFNALNVLPDQSREPFNADGEERW
jgi:hypothetical protein